MSLFVASARALLGTQRASAIGDASPVLLASERVYVHNANEDGAARYTRALCVHSAGQMSVPMQARRL